MGKLLNRICDVITLTASSITLGCLIKTNQLEKQKKAEQSTTTENNNTTESESIFDKYNI